MALVSCRQAVLESAWHSAENKAILNWAKLRNVVAAVARFKKILYDIRKSRTSSYSSNNDLDQLSRASGDSYQEDVLLAPHDHGLDAQHQNFSHYLHHHQHEDSLIMG